MLNRNSPRVNRIPGVRVAVVLAAGVLLGACASPGEGKAVIRPARRSLPAGERTEYGVASWHGPSRFSRESRTASGRKWMNHEFIAAHKHFPLGSFVRVTNLRNGRQVTVQITDRGPYVRGRVIDLSPAAADRLEMRGGGVAQVRIEAVESGLASAD